MTYAETMTQLRRMGTAQNAKVCRRHGAGDNLFGVSFANLGVLKKKIKVDHPLAQRLWASGNTDARTLATMIADPRQMAPAEAESWLADINYHALCNMLAGVVARSSFAAKISAKWRSSKKEYTRQCGYTIVGYLLKDGGGLSDSDGTRLLATIEREIHSSPNRARHAMNNVLIGIGVYRPSLTKLAIATAKRIGKVEVDHGETGCKTPDAAVYIQKARARHGC